MSNKTKFPAVSVGDIVYITTKYNESLDDFHTGLVVKLDNKYQENGEIDVFFLLKGWSPTTWTMNYAPDRTSYGWRLSDKLIKINKKLKKKHYQFLRSGKKKLKV